MSSIAESFVHVRLRTPDLTEELVRFLRRMGFPAREVDYGVVEVETDGAEHGQLRDYLRIWQGVNLRGDVDFDAA